MNFIVSQSEARDIAKCCLPLFLREKSDFMKGQWDVSRFSHLSFGKVFTGRALKVVDIYSRPLFWDFFERLSSEDELRVRIAADRRLRQPVISVDILPGPWALDAWRERTAVILQSQNPGNLRLVCHSYPRLGLLALPTTVVDLTGSGMILKFDKRDPEAGAVWSPLDYVKDSDAGVAHWIEFSRAIQALRWSDFESLVSMSNMVVSQQSLVAIPLPLKPEPQDNDDNCSPATATMILGFHGISVAEADAAIAMDTKPGIGTLPKDELSGYRQLTKGKFKIVPDSAPTFANAKDEVNDRPGHRGIPFKSGIARGRVHARAVAGAMDGPYGEFLYCYDPLNGGNPSPECWWDVAHTDFVYVRPL